MAEPNGTARWQLIIGLASMIVSVLVVIFGGVFWVANTALMKATFLAGLMHDKCP